MTDGPSEPIRGPGGLPGSPHFRLEPLADGVYAAYAGPTGAALCNAALVDLGGIVLVFDPFLTPKAARDLDRASQALFGRSPDVVVNSHCHFDHIRGNQAFPRARIVSTQGTRDLVVERNPPDFDGERAEFEAELAGLPTSGLPAGDIAGWSACCREVLESYGELRVVPADWTFETSMTLYGTRRRAQLHSYGPGHTRSDAFLLLPDDGIAVVGDLLTVRAHGSLTDGDTRNWRTTLDRLGRLPAHRLVPGHGPLASPADLGTFRTYLDRVEALADELADSGVDPERMEVGAPPAPFDRWWGQQFYRQNVREFVRRRLAARAGSTPPA